MNLTPNTQNYGNFTLPQKRFSFKQMLVLFCFVSAFTLLECCKCEMAFRQKILVPLVNMIK